MDDDFMVAGFRQTLNLIATVSTQCVESRQSLAFLLVADGLGQPYPAGSLRMKPIEIRQRYDRRDLSFLKVGAL